MQDIPDLVEGLKRSARVLAAFVQSIPEEKSHRRRGDGFWTIAEHVSHLAQVQPMLLERLQRFMAEDRPSFIPYVPADVEAEDQPPEMASAEALELFARSRRAQLALLGHADEAAWQKTGIHPEYDQYSLYILVRHILIHDYWHMYRMEELWLTRDAYLTAPARD
jgi:uncharacterized damage-inducible protein DinB